MVHHRGSICLDALFPCHHMEPMHDFLAESTSGSSFEMHDDDDVRRGRKMTTAREEKRQRSSPEQWRVRES